ncbi:hypothetical protein B0I35DRAFT_437949 [Stachybotrys elegans]|uniref:Uncharacterized protein n=1 Tax=Stachybotrys elegans TaxID=80388 RepID=A0A8K0SL75_9HYPO|nr:hypothetical protein B0I35DRAFT_437949 [Stachybotrys elegans]
MDSVERRIPKRWTDAEDKILYEEAKSQLASGQVKDWNRIAAKLPGRTNKDCRKRWINKVCGSLKKGAWDENEDERLREAVRVHGQRWAVIANIVGLRSPDQCAKRWQYSLDPRLEHGGWSPEEDDVLLELVRAHGRDWKLLHDQEFPTRSRNELKNRYSTLTRRSNQRSESRSTCSGSSPRGLEDWPQQPEDEVNTALARSGRDNSSSHRVASSAQDQWGGSRKDEFMMDNWADTMGTDWFQQLPTPFPSSAPSVVLSTGDGGSCSSSRGGVAFDDPFSLARSEASALAPSMMKTDEVMDPLQDSSAMQWNSESADHAFFPLDSGMTQDWKDNETLMSGTHAQTDLMGSTKEGEIDLTDPEVWNAANTKILRQDQAVRRVSLTVNQCDPRTLEDLLSYVRVLKGKVKLEIDL